MVTALCITGAYMIATWEPDDSIKPFSADFVSYDNTPTKGNELWDAMIETDAEEIELIEVIYRPEHGSCAFLYDRQEMNHFIKKQRYRESSVRTKRAACFEEYGTTIDMYYIS